MNDQSAETLMQALGDWVRTHHCAQLDETNLDARVCLMGWVQYRRDHGGLIFIDLRDREGLTQIVFSPDANAQAHQEAHVLRSEYVLAIQGLVRKRPRGMENDALQTGRIEVLVQDWKLLNTSQTPPFLLEERVEVSDHLRFKYRYLDLRRKKMTRHLKLRHLGLQRIRNTLHKQGFIEVETPVLTKSTPEGARDFLVPSRQNPGHFFALPQSPQLFKQLLMIGGQERYYQIVRCFRDEDLRADRQPEFTQIDLEMAFVQEDQVMDISELMMNELFAATENTGLRLPFPRMTYHEAMETYGLDRPDTRFGLPLQDVTDLVAHSGFKLFAQADMVKAIRVEDGGRLTRREIDDLTEFVKIFGAKGLAWIKLKADEWQSPIAKFLSEQEKQDLQYRLQLQPGDIVFFQAGSPEIVHAALGNLRLKLAEWFDLIPRDRLDFVWITDFPLFEWDQEEKRWAACHHPFTSPQEADLDVLETAPEQARARAYDLVLNGHEIGGGSIRIHQADIQRKMFRALGIAAEEAEAKFGFLLEALRYGAPPHGGIAFGLDRLMMILCGASSIREVIAFPKTQKGTCLLTEAPTAVPARQLRELNLRLRETPS
ncbi:MAG: aspartate--tRNA ligase [Desulfohalobiaceae bacterium]|nr:aspartate--tRNA ligase [Desulfohalobiaceae bacterium]